MPSPADREKALESALAQIDRQFGKGSVMRLGSDERAPVAVIPTGSIALDVALGVGGLPRGRIVEIYGPESSGKTTLTLHAIANVQRAGGIAAFVDAEHALDPDYAQKLGVDIDQLLVSQPDTGEQALEIADMLVRSGAIDLVVIDSVAALVPKAEIEGEMGDSHRRRRLMSRGLRKLTSGLSQTGTTMIFINQLREKIGVFFGSPETTAGGKALKFYASVRLDIRRIETLKDGTEAVGNRTRVKVVKNKMAPPFKQAEFDILYGVGISRESLIDYGVDQAIVKKSGAWYTYDGEQLGQGKENARNFLLKNPDIAADIETKILQKLGIGQRSRMPRRRSPTSPSAARPDDSRRRGRGEPRPRDPLFGGGASTGDRCRRVTAAPRGGRRRVRLEQHVGRARRRGFRLGRHLGLGIRLWRGIRDTGRRRGVRGGRPARRRRDRRGGRGDTLRKLRTRSLSEREARDVLRGSGSTRRGRRDHRRFLGPRLPRRRRTRRAARARPSTARARGAYGSRRLKGREPARGDRRGTRCHARRRARARSRVRPHEGAQHAGPRSRGRPAAAVGPARAPRLRRRLTRGRPACARRARPARRARSALRALSPEF